MDVTGSRLSLGHAQESGWESAQFMKVSKTLRVCQANDFVHLGSHLVLRNKTVSFVLLSPLSPLVESSFSEADVFLSPALFALLHRACPKAKGSFVRVFFFYLFYFFILVWGLFGYSAAWGLLSCMYQICSVSFGDVKWAVLGQNPSLLVVMFDDSWALFSRVASLNWWLFALGGHQFLLVKKGLKWRSEWKRELVLLRQGLTVLRSDLRSLSWSAPTPGLYGEICTTRIHKQLGEK